MHIQKFDGTSAVNFSWESGNWQNYENFAHIQIKFRVIYAISTFIQLEAPNYSIPLDIWRCNVGKH